MGCLRWRRRRRRSGSHGDADNGFRWRQWFQRSVTQGGADYGFFGEREKSGEEESCRDGDGDGAEGETRKRGEGRIGFLFFKNRDILRIIYVFLIKLGFECFTKKYFFEKYILFF